ncbi:hypothetical protein RJT34_28673 [Clitoria ternatea]|uniref:Uncharacterized protein n=1 Tax=Clitoria ternatea TaxID=43366 RepID=A0AAN9F951_CLITE
MAANVGALAIRGTSAMLNFLNSASFLPIVKSSLAKDKKAAAAEAANDFNPIAASSSLFTSHKKICFKTTKCKKAKNVPLTLMDGEIQGIILDTSLESMHNLDQEICDDVININTEKSNSGLSPTMVLDEEALFNMPSLG